MQLNKQIVRRSIVILSALLFPVTYVYLSPAMVFRGARLGILSGSYLTFGLLFVSALVFGRAWCGWVCPAAGFAEIAQIVDDRAFRFERAKLLKYAIWVPWLMAIALVTVLVGGGFSTVDPFLGTDAGISVHSLPMLAVYYVIVILIMGSSLLLGRRGFCHTVCWMAPFMVIGRKLSNTLRLPGLRLAARSDDCVDCGRCAKVCPMSLPIGDMVRTGRMEDKDCIVCGACVDDCTRGVLSLRFIAP